MEPHDPPTNDAIVDALRERVAERRRAGLYPPGWEDEMTERFARIERAETTGPRAVLRERIAALQAAARLEVRPAGSASRIPGGSLVHRLVARATARQVDAAMREVRRFAGEVVAAFEALAEAGDPPTDAEPRRPPAAG